MVALKNHTSVRTDSDRRESKGRDIIEYASPFGGFIFVCNNATVPDLDRQIFGLPARHEESVKAIRKGMPLFLYNYSTRLLHGIFEAASNGGYNLDPYAWENQELAIFGRGPVSRYPAQVKVRVRALRPPLDEETFRPVLDRQEDHKFRLELSQVQVQQLLRLFGAIGSENDWEQGDDLNMDSMFHRLPSPQEPESPNGVCKSDLDSCSVSSNGGNNFYEEELPDESDYDIPGVRGPVRSKFYNSFIQENANHRNSPLSTWKVQNNSKAFSEKLVSKGRHNLSYSAALLTGMHTIAQENKTSTLTDDCQIVSKENPRRYYQKNKSESLPLADQNSVTLRLHDVDPAVNSDLVNGLHTGRLQALNSKRRGTRDQFFPKSKFQPSLTTHERVPTVYSQQTGVRRSQKASGDESREFVSDWPDQQSNKQLVTQQNIIGAKFRSSFRKQHVVLGEEQDVQLPSFQLGQLCVPVCMQKPTLPQGQGCMSSLISPVFFSSPDATPVVDGGSGMDDVHEICNTVTDANRDGYQGFGSPGSWGLEVPVLLMPSFMQRVPGCIPTAELNIGALHYEILEFAKIARPSLETRLHAEAAIGCVRNGVRAVWPDADVEVFGSFATGLCLRHSDIDLAVVDAPSPISQTALSVAQARALLIRELSHALKAYSWCERLTVIDTASMPVLKCHCRPADSDSSVKSSMLPPVAIDITIGGMKSDDHKGNDTQMRFESAQKTWNSGKFGSKHTGGAAREYVIQRIMELPALFPLVLLLKSYLHHKGLSDVYTGGLGSFSLTLLLAFFLERVPIPCEAFLEGMPTDSAPFSPTLSSPLTCASEFSLDSDTASSSSGSGSGGTAGSSSSSTGMDHSIDMMGEFLIRRAAEVADKVLTIWQSGGLPLLGTLLLGFLQTFGFELDLSTVKIVLKDTDGKGGVISRDSSTRHMALWIDDPLRPGVNVGAGSYGMCHVQSAFREVLQILTNRQFFTMRPERISSDIPDLGSLYYLSGLFEIDDY